MIPADRVWRELVLSGIGGSAIAEAEEWFSHVEYRAWIAYLSEHGSFRPGHRLELVLARIAALLGYTLEADADPDILRSYTALQPLSSRQAMGQWA